MLNDTIILVGKKQLQYWVYAPSYGIIEAIILRPASGLNINGEYTYRLAKKKTSEANSDGICQVYGYVSNVNELDQPEKNELLGAALNLLGKESLDASNGSYSWLPWNSLPKKVKQNPFTGAFLVYLDEADGGRVFYRDGGGTWYRDYGGDLSPDFPVKSQFFYIYGDKANLAYNSAKLANI